MIIGFGDTVYAVDLLDTGLAIYSYSPLYYILRDISHIIWACLFIALFIIIIKTKLTHVEGFRKNFLIGVILLLLASSVWVIFLRFFFHLYYQLINLVNLIMAVFFITSAYFLIRGLLKLNNYLDSIIGTKEKRNNLRALIISIIIAAIYQVYYVLVSGLTFAIFTNIILMLAIFTSQLYISIYSFYLHPNFKDLKINMMLYFGIGFLFLVLILTFGQIFALNVSLNFTSINFSFLAFQSFLILGYVDFKNRISKIKAEI